VILHGTDTQSQIKAQRRSDLQRADVLQTSEPRPPIKAWR
jgi:hypothetical protein